MSTQNKAALVSVEALNSARARAKQTRQQLRHKPGPAKLLSPQELADAAPFYAALRDFISQLKAARVAAGLTLADVSDRSGLAVESLSKLETGALTNPTWKTLGAYAAAVGRQPQLIARVPNGDTED